MENVCIECKKRKANYVNNQLCEECWIRFMSVEGSEWFIIGSDIRPCWNCGTETDKVSISFETSMCSEYCEDVKYMEYERWLEEAVAKEEALNDLEEVLMAEGLGPAVEQGILKQLGGTGVKEVDSALSEAEESMQKLKETLRAHGIYEF